MSAIAQSNHARCANSHNAHTQRTFTGDLTGYEDVIELDEAEAAAARRHAQHACGLPDKRGRDRHPPAPRAHARRGRRGQRVARKYHPVDVRLLLQERHHRSEGGANAGLVIPPVLTKQGAHPLTHAVRANVSLQLGMRIHAVGEVRLLPARAWSAAGSSGIVNCVCSHGSLRSGCSGSRGILEADARINVGRFANLVQALLALAAPVESSENVGMVPGAAAAAPSHVQPSLHKLAEPGLQACEVGNGCDGGRRGNVQEAPRPCQACKAVSGPLRQSRLAGATMCNRGTCRGAALTVGCRHTMYTRPCGRTIARHARTGAHLHVRRAAWQKRLVPVGKRRGVCPLPRRVIVAAEGLTQPRRARVCQQQRGLPFGMGLDVRVNLHWRPLLRGGSQLMLQGTLHAHGSLLAIKVQRLAVVALGAVPHVHQLTRAHTVCISDAHEGDVAAHLHPHGHVQTKHGTRRRAECAFTTEGQLTYTYTAA